MTGLLAGAGPLAPLIVFLLAAAESAAFLGLVVPGELAVILGGVAAGTGSLPVGVMMLAACAGAVIGDSIGYQMGRRTGPTLLRRPRMAKVAERMDRAATLVAERGWWALVIARFASVLRAVVPFAAGMGNMRYRRFLLGNVIGGIAWGITFTLVGYVAGANYPVVEKWFRTGGLAVVGIAVVVGGIFWLTRWAQQNRPTLDRLVGRARTARPVRSLLAQPTIRGRGGFALVTTAVAIVGGSWIFGGLVQDILGGDEFFFFDVATIRYLAAHPLPVLIDVSHAVDVATNPAVLAAMATVATITAIARNRRRLAVATMAAVGGQWILVEIANALVDRTPPAVTPLVARSDYGFPSEHVAIVVAVAFLAAWPWNHPGWTATVRRYGIAGLVVALTAMARVALLVEYPSDTLAAIGAAGAWTLLVCLLVSPSANTTMSSGPA